ncbi:MAG TPA: hypothetical protein VMW47_01245 [Verrucomicrobiae bacterium]|nr:hypothetical protein [Verrucomicrobiae bacterium]
MGTPPSQGAPVIRLLDRLADPPPARWARSRVAVSGPALGLVLALLAGIGLLVLIVGFAVLMGANGRVSLLSTGTASSTAALLIQTVADLLLVIGGWGMSQAQAGGRRVAALGLGVAVIGALVGGGGGVVVELVILAVLYTLVAVSRIPVAAPAASGAGDEPR